MTQITRRSDVQSLLLMLVLMLGRGTRCKRRGTAFIPPDSTGLVGTPPADRPLLPLKFWANPRKSPLKPRSKDLEESALLRLMGQDFDPRWMRSGDHGHQHKQDGSSGDPEERATVRMLREMAGKELHLPDDLVPPEYRAAVTSWLVRRATCPIRYVWDDLGPYFWPRWVRRGECLQETDSDSSTLSSNTRNCYHPQVPASYYRSADKSLARPTSRCILFEGTKGRSEGRNSTVSDMKHPAPCSWPPGMMCMPGVARNLQILRWHCRLRKNMSVGSGANSNKVWLLSGGRGQAVVDKYHNSSSKSKRRKRYRCQWLKVPYPVPEDCVCTC